MAKKGKDALYVHDVLDLFTHGIHLHQDVVAQAGRVLRPLTARELKRLRGSVKMMEDSRSSPISEAARIIMETRRPRKPSAPEIALACRLGLAELLGGA